MYQEAEKLAEEVLKVHPGDETAQANAMAARNSMKLRSNAMGRVAPLVFCPPPLRFRRKLTRPHDCRAHVGCSNQNWRVETVSNDVNEARSFYDEEEEERLRDQEGDDEEDDEEDDPPLSKTHMANTGLLYTLQGVEI